MELKGKARSGSSVPAGHRARESPEGFARTYVTRWEIARWAHTYTPTHKHRTQWIICGVRALLTHTHSCRLTRSSIHSAADANLAWLHEWTNNLNTHIHTYVHWHTLALLATSATQRKSALLRIKTKGPKALTWCACFLIHPNLFFFLWQSAIFMASFSSLSLPRCQLA